MEKSTNFRLVVLVERLLKTNKNDFDIQKTEKDLEGEIAEFWKSVKIEPVKWNEKEYGTEGDGFWVVAIFSGKVIWYNDIEEGFNISEFKKLGEISEYGCEQDEISWAINKLYNLVKQLRVITNVNNR